MAISPVLDHQSDQRRIEELVNSLPRPIEILEAGCGRRWTLDLDRPYRLTGIDTDPAAVQARQESERDLDEAIVGDIRTADLPASRFDLIYCAFVLEHVEGAEGALINLERWLRPGGLLVIKVPDRSAMYGRAARLTPHWVHVWYYRLFRGAIHAGMPGHGPYPTHYDPVISRHGIEDFCNRRNLILEGTHLVDNYIRGSRLLKATGTLVELLSLGRIPWRWNDLTFLVRKPDSITGQS